MCVYTYLVTMSSAHPWLGQALWCSASLYLLFLLSLYFLAFVRVVTPVVSAEWIRLSPWHRMKAKSTGIKFQCNCLLNCGLQLLKSYPWFCVTTAVMNSVCLWFSNWQHHAKSEKHTTDWSNSEDRGRRKREPITDASDYWLMAIYSSYRFISRRLKGKIKMPNEFYSYTLSKIIIPICNQRPTKLNTIQKSISYVWNKTKTNRFWVVLCFQTSRHADLSCLALKPRRCSPQFNDSHVTPTDSYFRSSPFPQNSPWQHLPSCRGVQITHDWLIFPMLAGSTRCRVTDRKSLSVYFSQSEDVLGALSI